MIPKFKHRENVSYKIGDKEIYDSRSCAINAVVLGIYKGNTFALTEKRSKTMSDLPEKWCIPSGYFDWDEDGVEAITREIYEETGLYLPDYKKQLKFTYKVDNEIQPFYVKTSPKQNRQNIELYYIFIYDFDKGLPNVENYKNIEIEKVKWMIYFDPMYEWAFGHNEIIKKAVEKFKKYLK